MSIEIISILVNTIGVGVIGAAVALAAYYIKRYNLTKWIEKAVKAAEVIFDIPKSGEKKKEWVLKFIKENLNSEIFTDSMIEVLVEAAVEAINENKKKKETEAITETK